tara:strand:+ start:385 stop:816 length:432 start_codon:yes stop_codon:yes gene_type:complete
MAYKTKYNPTNISKYIGNPSKIICRSLWERRVCRYLDENVNILRWGSEELSIPYISPKDNKVHNYFPDFIIEKKNKDEVETIVIEVKPKRQTSAPKKKKKITKTYLQECLTFSINEAKWESAEIFCKKRGWKFIILTEDNILP